MFLFDGTKYSISEEMKGYLLKLEVELICYRPYCHPSTTARESAITLKQYELSRDRQPVGKW